MEETTQSLSQRLEEEGQKTLDFYEKFPPGAWETQVYSEGSSWSARRILMHIVEVESSIPRLVASILDGGSGVSEDFDIDRYNESKVAKMGEPTPKELLDEFKKRRAHTVEMIRAMNDDQLAIEGRHPFLGVTQIVEMLRLMYVHIQIHQRDTRRALNEA